MTWKFKSNIKIEVKLIQNLIEINLKHHINYKFIIIKKLYLKKYIPKWPQLWQIIFSMAPFQGPHDFDYITSI